MWFLLTSITTQAAWITTDKVRYSTPSTAVAQEDPRVAQTQAAEDRRITQRVLPEEQPDKIGPLSCCTAPPQDFHWSPFSFSESRTAFSFAVQKKKWFWPPPGRRINSPCRASRNQHNRKGVPFRRRKKQICEVPLPGRIRYPPLQKCGGWQKSGYPQGVRPTHV